MLKDVARYGFGLKFARFMALNDDKTIPRVDRMVAGVGPFDFSGVEDISDVVATVKIDNGLEVDLSIDLAAASIQSAVTAEEYVDALNVALLAAGLDLEATVAPVTGRVTLQTTITSDLPSIVQFYGEGAKLAKFGQGFGLKFIKSDTLKSLGDTPTQKDQEEFTTTDANGLDTEILTDGYRKGFSASIVDAAEDFELLALIEGGSYDEETGVYEVPTSSSTKVYFYCEAFYAQYEQGTNKEADLVGYVGKLFRTCKGSPGDKTHERGFADGNYTITGTSYKDENGVVHGDTVITKYSIEEYEALDLWNV